MNKVNTIEAGMVITLVALAETAEFALTWLGIGLIANYFIHIPTWFFSQLWLKWKGIKGTKYVYAALGEFIPVWNALPAKTITLIVIISLHNKKAGLEEATASSIA